MGKRCERERVSSHYADNETATHARRLIVPQCRVSPSNPCHRNQKAQQQNSLWELKGELVRATVFVNENSVDDNAH